MIVNVTDPKSPGSTRNERRIPSRSTHAGPLAPPYRLGLVVPPPERRRGPHGLGLRLHDREQRQRVEPPLVAHPMELGRRLVEHVARADLRAPVHPLAVLVDELAAGEVDEGLDAVPVRPDLDPGRDPVELEADGHGTIPGHVT